VIIIFPDFSIQKSSSIYVRNSSTSLFLGVDCPPHHDETYRVERRTGAGIFAELKSMNVIQGSTARAYAEIPRKGSTMVRYIEKEFKTILNVSKFIDSWFWVRYGVNPYNGCQFGCIYCDSRSAKYHLPTDFENTILVKKSIGTMLDKRLTNARTLLPDVTGTGGTTDPYQPAERKYENTKQCLQVLAKHRYPVLVGTKSGLVLRDLDLLENIGKNTWCTVGITITTTDPEKAKFLETSAPSPETRLNAIRTIKEKTTHIQAGVWLIPVVPFLTDSDNDLEEVIRASKEASADFILFGGGMTMRDMQANWFLKHLQERDRDLIKNYEELYQFKYNPDTYSGQYEPSKKYSTAITRKFLTLAEKYHIPTRIRRYIPHDFRRDNYIIAEKLLNEAYQLQALGKPWSNKFWAGQNIQNLKEPIYSILKRNELQKIRNVNGDIESFIKEYFASTQKEFGN
jgi:DNA repair photolyase